MFNDFILKIKNENQNDNTFQWSAELKFRSFEKKHFVNVFLGKNNELVIYQFY